MVASSSLRNLPRDLLTKEIFLRLPTRSLLQCKSVCKEWHGIISNQSFIEMHFNHDTNRTQLLLYYNRIKDPGFRFSNHRCTSYSYFPDVETWERHQVPDHLFLWGEITFLRGPCNGIFCIHIRENKFALWNPTTRRFRPILCHPCLKFDEVGFGVDPLTGDFKIVLIRSRFGISPFYAIYTSSNHSWRYFEDESLGYPWACICTSTSGSNTFLNGTYYWMLDLRLPEIADVDVLAFDMHNETFQQIETPEMIGLAENASLHLFNDSLAFVSCSGEHAEIWLLEEGSGDWTKFLYVVLPARLARPIGFWGANKMLVRICGKGGKGSMLVMYDLESHSENLLDDEMGNVYLPIHYKETLASVKGEHGIEDYDTRSVEGLKFLGYKGRYTKIGCYGHRRDAQLGTEQEQYLRDNYEFFPDDLDSEGTPCQPEMEEGWRNDPYA